MFKLLGGLSVYFKYQPIRTDNAVFRLHNIFTTVLLLTCSMIITATQLVGTPIQCIVNGIPTHVVNTFCWITSTFTMPDAFAREVWADRKHLAKKAAAESRRSASVTGGGPSTAPQLSIWELKVLAIMGDGFGERQTGARVPAFPEVGKEVAHPGVLNEYDSSQEKKYYTYYQWVCFVLFFQAMMCYTPKMLWDACEGDLLKTIVMGLNIGVCRNEEKEKKKDAIIGYLIRYERRHKLYALRYWGCELLCLVNIVLQLWMMDSFFNGEFFSYGTRVLGYSDVPQEERYDPMIYIFPRITKCTFHKFGASGGIQTHDSLCILPLNIVNEKTYIFLWFWYIILAIVLVLLVMYRLVIIFMPSVRPRLLHARSRTLAMETAVLVSRRTDLGDWWLLYMLARNMDPLIYRELILELAKRMGEKPSARA